MADTVELTERPETRELYMIAGWRQWADAGSISSGLPQYLVRQNKARRIGTLRPDGFYLFQIPGTHDLVRPVIRFQDGFPQQLETQRNELFYTGDENRGVIIFLGDEPHLDIDRYADAILETAKTLGVKRIITLGGVYGELPYNKERMVSCIYSQESLKEQLSELAVTFSDYHGGASIGSYICRKAYEQRIDMLGFYAFVPTYNFANFVQATNSNIQIENDYMAWLGVMRRVNYMLKTRFDLVDLERKSEQLIKRLDAKVNKLANSSPQLGVREYFENLAEEFTETPFDPLADVWEEELRRIFDDPNAVDDE